MFDGSYIVGLQAARTFVDLRKQNTEKLESDIKESVAQTYYSILILEENKKILDSTLILTRKALYESMQFQKSGFMEETDVDQLQLLAQSLENNMNMISRQVENTYNGFKFLIGIDIKTTIKLTDNLNALLDIAIASNIIDKNFDYQNHINYKILQTTESLNLLQLRKDKSAYLPSLNAFLTTSRNAFRDEFNFLKTNETWYKTTIFGVNFNLPIWNSGIRHFKIQEDKLELKKTRLNIYQAQQGMNLEVQNRKAELKTFTDQYFTEVKNLELAKKIYQRTLIKYNQGVTGSLDLSQIQNQYLNVQRNYFNSMLQLLIANSNLNKALGL